MKIENTIHPPNNLRGRSLKYPWDIIQINESFEVECARFDADRVRKGLVASANSYSKYNNLDRKFVTRISDKGVRIWRVK